MICITFDTDHMSEARMTEFLSSVPIPGHATFFCTQRYECLEKGPHELGPHPHLPPGGDWEQELESKRKQFPSAIGWRSHSCVFSHLLAEWLGRNGYRYVSCHDELYRPDVQPTQHAWGVWHFPIFYMDNLDFSRHRFWKVAVRTPFSREIIDTACTGDGVYVFDFHPIHLLLNSPDAEYYLQVRPNFLNGGQVSDIRHVGYGTASFFHDLSARMIELQQVSLTLAEALGRIQNRSMPKG